jgi:predicted nucleic acid-binding protein
MVSSTVVVDSSVLVAFYLTDDSQHDNAVQVLSEVREMNMLLHPFVIQEVVTVLTYRSGVALAKNFVSDVQQADNVFITNLNVEADLSAFKKLRLKISLADIAVVSLASEQKAQLLTFDQQMLAAAKKLATI